MTTLFYFWDDPATLPQVFADNIAYARDAYPDWDVRLIGDGDAATLLQQWPEILAVYDRLWIPAVRSDIIRLAALYAHGGWYMDCDSRPVGDLRPYVGDREVIMFRDNRPILVKRGTVHNAFMYMPKGSTLARLCLDAVVANLRDQTNLHQVLKFSGPDLLAQMVKTRAEDSYTKIWQLRTLIHPATELVGDDPLFKLTEDTSTSSWRILQGFGVLTGLEPDWRVFPKTLRPRFAHTLRKFAKTYGQEAAILQLAEARPSYLERPGFVKLVEQCRAKLAKRSVA